MVLKLIFFIFLCKMYLGFFLLFAFVLCFHLFIFQTWKGNFLSPSNISQLFQWFYNNIKCYNILQTCYRPEVWFCGKISDILIDLPNFRTLKLYNNSVEAWTYCTLRFQVMRQVFKLINQIATTKLCLVLTILFK